MWCKKLIEHADRVVHESWPPVAFVKRSQRVVGPATGGVKVVIWHRRFSRRLECVLSGWHLTGNQESLSLELAGRRQYKFDPITALCRGLCDGFICRCLAKSVMESPVIVEVAVASGHGVKVRLQSEICLCRAAEVRLQGESPLLA